MIESIEEYLKQLRKELNGCDRATVQDALSDAEEHLRTALDNATADSDILEADALSGIIEEYGAPEEIATAYREIERRVVPTLAQESPPAEFEEPERHDDRPFIKKSFGVFTEPRAWGALLYLLFSLGTGIIYFTWVVTCLSLSAGLMVLIIGLPIALLFILSVRGIGLVEGRIVEALLGIRMPRRPVFYRTNPEWWQRFKLMFLDRHTWLSLLYMVLHLPFGIFYFTLFVTLVAVALTFIVLPFLQLGSDIPLGYVNGVVYHLAGWAVPIIVIIGILLATATMHLARYLGRQQGRLAKAMLVRN